MNNEWKTLATEAPPAGAWVLVWDNSRKFASVAKHGKIAWQASGFTISFNHGTHWMKVVPPEIQVVADGRICTACKQTLPLVYFSKNNRNVGGLSRRCKLCDSSYAKSPETSSNMRRTNEALFLG
jgi:hypothetical protein